MCIVSIYVFLCSLRRKKYGIDINQQETKRGRQVFGRTVAHSQLKSYVLCTFVYDNMRQYTITETTFIIRKLQSKNNKLDMP